MGILATHCQKLGVGTALNDVAVLQYQNLICAANRAQSVGDDKAGAAG